ncbi:MAG: HPr kinase/phosphorylase [Ignavibacteria bacterium]|jgi:HPr kinase/phosphorylase|nr:HPr kinase/phosphorylase [Ignavibacteria bacterium]
MHKFKDIKEIKKESITVEFFYEQCKERFKLEKLSPGEISPEKIITDKDIHRPGLALAGYVDLFTNDRVQIFGNTEMKYLNQLSPEKRIETLTRFFSFNIPCVIITNDNHAIPEIQFLASETKTPLFCTPYPTTRFAYFIADFLDDQFAVQAAIHGSFIDVYGVGLLFYGKSGIGKSEIALDLVERGHRLVADDIVMVLKKGESVLMGAGTSLSKNFMEIRGLGIIDVRSIFGIRAIRYQKRVEVIVELEDWEKNKAYERTGLDSKNISLLGIDVEHVNLPIFPGKNITVIAEVIALNYLCKHYGYNAAVKFQESLEAQIQRNSFKKNKNGLDRSIEYFEHDFE